MKNDVAKYSLIESGIAIIYVVLVAGLMSSAERLFESARPMVTGTVFLLLLVFSAATMGVLIFGRSILWYLDGQKKEALNLLVYKFILLFVFLAAGLLSLMAF